MKKTMRTTGNDNDWATRGSMTEPVLVQKNTVM